MKTIIAMMAVLLTLNTFASTHEGVVPYLDFDEDYEISDKADNGYLVVVPEEWTFPDQTPLEREQKEKFIKALAVLEEVMNSEEFKRKVLSYKRSDGQRLFQKNYLWDNSSKLLSNEDVFNLIIQGNEKMRSNTLGEMNINSWVKQCSWWERTVRRAIWCQKVIGSTDPRNSKWIKVNWKFYAKFETHQMVSNLVHEWLHLLGFLHGNVNMREEVPYVVGQIAGEVAKSYLK